MRDPKWFKINNDIINFDSVTQVTINDVDTMTIWFETRSELIVVKHKTVSEVVFNNLKDFLLRLCGEIK